MAETQRHEAGDVDAGRIVLIGAVLAAIVVLCVLAVLGWRAWLARGHAGQVGPATSAQSLQRFATPKLETAPAQDLTDYEGEKAAKLNSYRWLNRSEGIVQIPIEQAMQRLIAREAQK